MMNDMKKKLSGFLKILLPFAFLLFLVQYVMVNYVFNPQLYYSTFTIYSFHLIATFLVYLLLVYVHDKFEDKTGFAFMATSLLKMLAALIFLLPMLLSDIASAFTNVLAFFIPYFLFLVLETIYAVRLLTSS